MAPERPQSRTQEGVVVSAAMDKTIIVAVRRRIRHRQYRKYVIVSKRFRAHDERNECSVGDRVIISESRPLSKTKRWRLRSILQKAVKDVEIVDEIVLEAVETAPPGQEDRAREESGS